ncbi:MAG: polysaccharide deacetylase family protein [Acidobacteria bacterium]|nr:polysaccharide deacetylase family protein [Acidobacteriota bacterium]
MNSPCWIVFYHYLRPSASTSGRGIRALSPQDFAQQLDWLAQHADIVDYNAFASAFARRRGFARPAVLLTFDDGVLDHFEVAYVELKRRGLSGVFFLNGDPLEEPPRLLNVHRTHLLLDELGAASLLGEVRRVLSTTAMPDRSESPQVYRYDGEPEQVVKRLLNYELPYDHLDRVLTELVAKHLGEEAAIARRFYLSAPDVRGMALGGMTFGYHTRRHRVLSRLDEAGQIEELAGGVARVRELTGQQTVPFCYPYGHSQTFDATTIRLLPELGYEMAFTTGRRPARPDADAPFEIPRFDTVDLPPRTTADLGLPQELRL